MTTLEKFDKKLAAAKALKQILLYGGDPSIILDSFENEFKTGSLKRIYEALSPRFEYAYKELRY